MEVSMRMGKIKSARTAAMVFAAAITASPAGWASTHTWIGTANSWGFVAADPANAVWTGNGGGLNVPPNNATGISAEVFIGNGGSVNLGGQSWGISYLHLGQAGPNFPGTGQLTIDTGSISIAQNVYIG